MKALALSFLLAVAAAAPAQDEPAGTDDGEAPRQETAQQDREAGESAPEPSAEGESEEVEVEAADRFEPSEQIDEDFSIDFPIDI